MKKTYIQPSSKAFEVEIEEIIADSSTTAQIPVGGSGPSKGDEYRNNLWGD